MSESAAKTASTSQADKTAGAEMAMNADPAMMRANMPTTLEGEIQRAQELRSKGNYDEAGRSFAQLLLVAPDDARVVGGYGKVLEQQGHSQQALAFLKHAVELNPNDWSLQSALGIAYDQNDDHKSARGAYDRALALKPGEGSVLNNYAVSRMLAGDYASAKRMFAEAQSRGVSNPKIALNLDKLASLNEVPAASVAVPAKPMIDAKSAAASETTVQTGPVTVANLGAPAAQSTVHASPAKPASNSAMTAPVPPAAKTPSGRRVAIAGPKPLAPTVVMQKVPVDPLAGPTKHREHSVQKLASTSHQPAKPVVPKATAAAAPAAPPPALRTAADGD